MNLLENYLSDGANRQAKAVLCMLQTEPIESSWSKKYSKYLAEINVARWENGREQGYVVFLKHYGTSEQINIAFFEHRNSDEIHAIEWNQSTFNAPTLEDLENTPNVYEDKYDTTQKYGYGQINHMADWIHKRLTYFWNEQEQEK